MKNKNLLYTVIYWVIGLALFVIAYLLFAFGTLHIFISSFTDKTLFRTTVDISASIPGNIYLLGGSFVSSVGLNVSNAIGIKFNQIINNITFEGFKIDWIACSVLVGSLLVFIVDAIFKKFKAVNYTCGGIIAVCGIALFFEPISFWYFNKDMFNDLYQYLDSFNNNNSNSISNNISSISANVANNVKVAYSNPCVYIGAFIILITGLSIIGYQVYKSIKEKKNASIENEVIESQN